LAYYNIDIEGNHTISVEYIFVHRKIEDDIIKVQEQIYIEWVRKEAILDFDIQKSDNYAPIIVSFDASKSIVKDENIVKFIWDYWDWIIEERDSIVPWHKYLVAWDYIIKLKVITESWKEFETSKKLILKPKPQSIKISSSMKRTIVWQWIDFSSKESEWQIISYLWKFWDWKTSTEANPTHSYYKKWEYTVELQVDFDNNNVMTDSVKIEVVDEY
jgi:PKD repeat protein